MSNWHVHKTPCLILVLNIYVDLVVVIDSTAIMHKTVIFDLGEIIKLYFVIYMYNTPVIDLILNT